MPHRPHILLILTDQQRADCVGCAGHSALRTPNIDWIASQGVRFTSAFTSSPLCVPARLSLATGLYPHNSNLWTGDQTLPPNSDTYMHHLRDAGYRTCTIGKNHLYPMENCDLYASEPCYRNAGFDHVQDMSGTWGVIGGTSVYTDHMERLGIMQPLRAYLAELETQPDEQRRYVAQSLPIPAEHYIDAFVGRRVADYVDSYDDDAPSFVYVGFQGPHEPWDAPDEYANRFAFASLPDLIPELPQGEWLSESSHAYHRFAQYYPPPSHDALCAITARYLGKIAQIDDAVGIILDAYRRKGWLDHTAIVFASDHGEMLGDHNRLSKSVFYESALRVPMIVALPRADDAVAPDRRTCDALVELIDMHATLIDLGGGEPSRFTDSRSLLPCVRGETATQRDDLLAEVHAHYMLRTTEWKIVVGHDGQTLQLFDLAADPLEQRNLCGHPDYSHSELDMRSRLLARLARDTYRPGRFDPEFCQHAFPEDETP